MSLSGKCREEKGEVLTKITRLFVGERRKERGIEKEREREREREREKSE